MTYERLKELADLWNFETDGRPLEKPIMRDPGPAWVTDMEVAEMAQKLLCDEFPMSVGAAQLRHRLINRKEAP